MSHKNRFVTILFLVFTILLSYLNYRAWFRYPTLKKWNDKYVDALERLGWPASSSYFFYGPTAEQWFARLVVLISLLIAASVPVSLLLGLLGIVK